MTEIKISKTEKKLRHYITKAVADYKLFNKGEKVMLCLSGGKDSFGLLKILHGLIKDGTYDIDLYVYTLDQSQPGWDDSRLRKYLDDLGVSYEIETKNTYGVVIDKVPEGKTYCSLCSRLRRGNIYRYAKEHKMDKIILGHHRDDLIEFAKEEDFPIIPCNLCGSQENLKRKKVKKLIQDLAHENPKVPSNILNSLSNVLPSHLMDRNLHFL